MIDFDEIEARANAATQGPWTASRSCSIEDAPETVVMAVGGNVANCDWDYDAAFIAAARTDVPALVAEVRRLREVIHGMIGQCRFSCTSASHCRVCGTGYEAINEP